MTSSLHSAQRIDRGSLQNPPSTSATASPAAAAAPPSPSSSLVRARVLADPAKHARLGQAQRNQRLSKSSHMDADQSSGAVGPGPIQRLGSLVSTSEADGWAQRSSQWPARDPYYLNQAPQPRTDSRLDVSSPLPLAKFPSRQPPSTHDQNPLNWAANSRLPRTSSAMSASSIAAAYCAGLGADFHQWDRSSPAVGSTAAPAALYPTIDSHRARQKSLWNGQFDADQAFGLRGLSLGPVQTNGSHRKTPRHPASYSSPQLEPAVQKRNAKTYRTATTSGAQRPHGLEFLTNNAQLPAVDHRPNQRHATQDPHDSNAQAVFVNQYATLGAWPEQSAVQDSGPARALARVMAPATASTTEQQRLHRALSATSTPPAQGYDGLLPNQSHARRDIQPVSAQYPPNAPIAPASEYERLQQHMQQWQMEQDRMYTLMASDPNRGYWLGSNAGMLAQYSHQAMASGGALNSAWPTSARPAPVAPHVADLNPSQTVASPLLLEFHKANGVKSGRRFELRDIHGHVAEFAGDQFGSRFIQHKLETANSDERGAIFNELLPNAMQLMKDVFGNYVIQKFFEHGDQSQKKMLAARMKGQVLELAVQLYACRVVQKALEHVLVDQQAAIVKELEHHVMKCVKDPNGNHVIQKAIERVPFRYTTFIVEAFLGQALAMSIHSFGCRVMQRLLEHAPELPRRMLLAELHPCALTLMTDQYGNYVTQHIIENGPRHDKERLIQLVLDNLLPFARQKYASNVVERTIMYGSDEQRHTILLLVCSPEEVNENTTRCESTLLGLIRHEFANYVIQRLLLTLCDEDYTLLVTALRPELEIACKNGTTKQLEGVREKMQRFATRGAPFMGFAATPGAFRHAMSGDATRSAAHTPSMVTDDTNSQQSGSLAGSAPGSASSNSPFHVNFMFLSGGKNVCKYR